MADGLVRLIIFVLFISFRPIASDADLNQRESNVNIDQHVKEESTVGKRSEEDLQDQASAAENAEKVEGQGKPGFFSQIFSEIAAPLFEEEEEGFLSEEGSKDSHIKVGELNPDKAAEDSSDDSPKEHQENVPDALEGREQLESEIPQFTVAKYLKSVTEDSQTVRTTDSGEGTDQRKVIWPDVASVPYVSSRTDSDSAKSADNEGEISSNSNDDIHQDNQKEHSKLTEPATSSELSDEDLEHLRVKSKGSTSGEEDTLRDKDPKVERVGDAPDLSKQGDDEVERQIKGDHVDKRDGLDLSQVKSKAPTEKDMVDSEVSEVDQELTDQGEIPDSDGRTAESPDGMGKNDYGEDMDEGKDTENLQTTPSAEDVAKTPNVERVEEHLEVDRQKASDDDNFDGAVKSHSDDHTVQSSEVKKPSEGEAVEGGMNKLKHQEEARNKEQEMLRKQQDEVQQKARIAEEKKRRDEPERQQRLESLRKQLAAVEHEEKMEAERKQKIKEEQKDKGGHREKMAADNQVGQQKLENGKGNLINNMRKQEVQGKQIEKPPGKEKAEMLGRKVNKLPEKRGEKVQVKTTGKPPEKVHVQQPNDGKVAVNNKQEQASLDKERGDKDEERKLKGARLDKEEAELKRKLESLSEERRKFEKMAEDYQMEKHGKQPKVQKEQERTQQRHVKESPKSPVKEQEVPAKIDQASILLPVSVTSIISSWTPTPPVKQIIPTKTETSTPATSSTTKATPDPVVVTKETIRATASSTVASTAPAMQASQIYTPKVGLPEEVAKPPEKDFLGETQPLGNATKDKVTTPSAYATFIQAFRSFHESSLQVLLSYWPAVRNGTRDVLSHVGLDSMFEQLCDDLANVHPAVLLATFLFGTLGIFYFMWSLTFGRTRQGAQGPHLRDVLRSQLARIRILEEEVKASSTQELDSLNARDKAIKEVAIIKEQLEDNQRVLDGMRKEIEQSQKRYEEVNEYLEKVTRNNEECEARIKEKAAKISEYEDQISELETEVEAKQHEIGQLANDLQEKRQEIQASKQQVKELGDKIQQGDEEIDKLQSLLQEAKERKQSLQVEFDDQLLRMTELQQQYNFKCDEVEVLQDCLKQIKGNVSTTDEEREDTDPAEMEKRLVDMMDVAKAKSEAKIALEERDAMATDLEEYRKTSRVLKDKVEELEEKLVHVQANADQAALIKREKEIELETLERYFKSTEVELHRKLAAEGSARINTQNQLQSEQAKASTAVVDADKYRQLYLEIKQQIEEIDQTSKEQLSNMEAKAHQNWLDYRAAAKERDAFKDENDLLRRKLYDMEVRGSRPSSSASSNHMNHVDGRDSPRHSPHMSGPPGHGSPVLFAPMMGPPPPPPPSMFPGQRRHPADMMMTPPPPRPPFPPPGHVTTPPPLPATSTPQSSKSDDRDDKDGSPHLPPPPPPPMSGFGPRPLPPMMGMPRFPLPPPMMPPPLSGGKGPLPRVPMMPPAMLRGPLPPPMPGPRPSP